jgi:acetyl-CoA carboxylase biotin carboxyl carrier protein
MSEPDLDRDAAQSALVESVWAQAEALIDRLEGTSVQRLCVEAGACKIEIERALPASAAGPMPAPGPPVATAQAAAVDGAAGAEDGRPAVTAPLVGRFYRASQPGAAPFVEVGDVIEAGQTVCIVEAMKMMNEVPAPEAGRVAEIAVEDGEYVEFEQVLMRLDPVDA